MTLTLERDINRMYRHSKLWPRKPLPKKKPRNAFKIAYQAYRFEVRILNYMFEGLQVDFDKWGPAFNKQMESARALLLPKMKALHGEKMIKAAVEASMAVRF